MPDDLLVTVRRELDLHSLSGFYSNNFSITDTLNALLDRCTEAESGRLAAERIENAHLREAFVVMERAANKYERDMLEACDLANFYKEQFDLCRAAKADQQAVLERIERIVSTQPALKSELFNRPYESNQDYLNALPKLEGDHD